MTTLRYNTDLSVCFTKYFGIKCLWCHVPVEPSINKSCVTYLNLKLHTRFLFLSLYLAVPKETECHQALHTCNRKRGEINILVMNINNEKKG